MFKGVDHVVVAVRDIEAAVSRYETIYGMSVTTRAEEAATSMKMAFFRFADTYTVLVSSSDEKGRIATWINERGESVWIVAMKVDDITATVAELRDKGVSLIGDPGPGVPAKGQRVFIDAAETGGYLMQFIQR
jgi:methylmalonyl-CoA/ethylmalonyl-CoA epimerase